MSKPTKNGGGTAEAAPDLSFEQAIQKLETIVEEMESQDLPLENLLSRFEEGTKLAKVCQTKLADAEVKIQQLERNAKGDLTTKPVDLDNP